MDKISSVIASAALAVGLAACGGGGDDDPETVDASVSIDAGSGISGDRQIGSLTPAEQQAFCEYMIATEGGPGSVHECDGLTLTASTVENCVADFVNLGDCTATVAQAEACAEAIGMTPCGSLDVCDPLFACAGN
jgi:hypothetical protein